MLILGLLLVLLAIAVGFYAQANGTTHDFTIFGYHWTTYDWVPVAVAAGAGVLLFVLAVAYFFTRVRGLRRANAALQKDVDLLKLERATQAIATRERAEAEKAVARDRDLVGRPDAGRAERAPAEHVQGAMAPWPSTAAPRA